MPFLNSHTQSLHEVRGYCQRKRGAISHAWSLFVDAALAYRVIRTRNIWTRMSESCPLEDWIDEQEARKRFNKTRQWLKWTLRNTGGLLSRILDETSEDIVCDLYLPQI
jgi:hypothetical protein